MSAAIICIGVVSLLAVVTLRQDLAGAPGTDPAALITHRPGAGRGPWLDLPARA